MINQMTINEMTMIMIMMQQIMKKNRKRSLCMVSTPKEPTILLWAKYIVTNG